METAQGLINLLFIVDLGGDYPEIIVSEINRFPLKRALAKC